MLIEHNADEFYAMFSRASTRLPRVCSRLINDHLAPQIQSLIDQYYEGSNPLFKGAIMRSGGVVMRQIDRFEVEWHTPQPVPCFVYFGASYRNSRADHPPHNIHLDIFDLQGGSRPMGMIDSVLEGIDKWFIDRLFPDIDLPRGR